MKVYESEKVGADDGDWRHEVIRLRPDAYDPSYVLIVLTNLTEGELTIVAELVEVLG